MKDKHDDYVTKGGIKINKYLYLCLVVALFIVIGIAKLALSGSDDSKKESDNGSSAQIVNNTEASVYESNATRKDTEKTTAKATEKATEKASKESVKTYSFRTQKQATEHFEKHGQEFPYSSLEEYVAGANKVIADKNALTKTEKEDGDYVYYLEKTNEFVIVSTDGYLRTYFKPSAGKAYYDRQ